MTTHVSQEIVAAIEHDIREMIPRLWGISWWTRKDIPCNHPCSLMRKDIPNIRRKKYMVGAKADGTRAFMLFSFTTEPEQDYVAMVDRTYAHRNMRIHAPPDYYSGTLLDGELVKMPDGTEEYLVFDVIAMSGHAMFKKSHTERYGEVIRIVNTINSPDIKIRAKKWFVFGNVGYEEVVRSIPVKSDGLIFVPDNGMPLSAGRQADHYKWKTASDHTIDFLLEDGVLWLERRGVRERAGMEVKGHEGLTGVVECSLQRKGNGWVATVVRTRPDKVHANDVRVAELTLKNIEENIEVEELMDI